MRGARPGVAPRPPFLGLPPFSSKPSLVFAFISLLTTYADRCILAYMKRTNIWLKEGHWKKLKAISEKTGAPVSALIRKAIDEYLKKKKKA